MGGAEDIDGVGDALTSALYAPAGGSIGSIRGLLRPQTTINAPSIDRRFVSSDELATQSQVFFLSPV